MAGSASLSGRDFLAWIGIRLRPSLAKRRWGLYLAAALLSHALVLGGLLYAGLGLRMPAPPTPIVVAELIPAEPDRDVATTEPGQASPSLEAAGTPTRIEDATKPLPREAPGMPAAVSPTLPARGPADGVAGGMTAPAAPPAASPAATLASARTGEDAREPDARERWELQTLAHLDRFKRYPAMAQALGEEDQVFVRVRVDRTGQVMAHRIVDSRGYRRLDEEALALIERASPLPAPSADIAERDLEFTIPIDFFIEKQRVSRLW